MHPWVKRFVLPLVPERLLLPIQRARHLRTVRTLRDDEEPDFVVVRRLVSHGDCAIDAGANIGIYTKLLSDLVGAEGRVTSVEPVPATFENLSYVVARSGLTNVRLLNVAVSDREGSVRMTVPESGPGGRNYYQARIVGAAASDGAPQFEVPCRTLDGLFPPPEGPVAFIKMDVEGHELPGMRGAAGLLARQRPALLLEVSGEPEQPGSDAAALADMLGRLGYAAYWFDGQRLRPRGPGVDTANTFFLTAAQLARVADLQ